MYIRVVHGNVFCSIFYSFSVSFLVKNDFENEKIMRTALIGVFHRLSHFLLCFSFLFLCVCFNLCSLYLPIDFASLPFSHLPPSTSHLPHPPHLLCCCFPPLDHAQSWTDFVSLPLAKWHVLFIGWRWQWCGLSSSSGPTHEEATTIPRTCFESARAVPTNHNTLPTHSRPRLQDECWAQGSKWKQGHGQSSTLLCSYYHDHFYVSMTTALLPSPLQPWSCYLSSCDNTVILAFSPQCSVVIMSIFTSTLCHYVLQLYNFWYYSLKIMTKQHSLFL